MGKMFGTDGIRGVANRELTPEIAYKMGRVAGYVLAKNNNGGNDFIIARDTRVSGQMLEGALVAGLTSVGVNVHLAGVISTPAAAYLTKELDGCGGVMISASHNAYPDNGIKFFSADGFKLPDRVEEEMETLYFQEVDNLPRPEAGDVGRVCHDTTAEERYLKYLLSTVPCRFDGIKIVLDCANGAAFRLGPQAFQTLGADVIAINDAPDGVNINHNCGSTYPEAIGQAIRENNAQLGFTFDGDADRVLAVDEAGNLVDGDAIMTILAMSLKEKGLLKNNAVVATVMSNLGLEKAAQAQDFKLLRTKVGDRYVLEQMQAGGYCIGGEQSGHIILLDYNTTGDGVLTALQLAAVVAEKNQSLSQLASHFTRYPQVLVNCRVGSREGWDTNSRIKQAMQDVEEKLAGRGRLLVRPSGTEPLIRVMLEGQDEEELNVMANGLAEIIKEEQA
ncbi:phosphoglucosamine mutase [Dethiobacter alkaliphilus]|uniref:Phosphoglucosamine mutase n=1 Tax=Dethiobacter alkaliphilus AHT 1 TaxID=555088 RepID=C0GCM4_DETAL|nr:phosphoglucosamine mutase [Dethiobacter alkaliphilus]EEG78959.1 phosphoglucosamine mutase [Dethiobacter alkaliphilus AHT 1]